MVFFRRIVAITVVVLIQATVWADDMCTSVSGWRILQKIDSKTFLIGLIYNDDYGPHDEGRAILVTEVPNRFQSTGSIGWGEDVIQKGTRKVKMDDGFERDIPIYFESSGCTKQKVAQVKAEAQKEQQLKAQQEKKIATQRTESLKNIEGIWLNGCVKDDPGPGMSFLEVEKYNSGRTDIFRIYFNDSNCAAAKSYVIHITGVYKTGDFVDRQRNIKVIDLTPQKYEVAPLNEQATNKFNEDIYLGYMDWKERTPKDVTRNKEFRNKVGKIIYSIYKLEGEKSYGPWPTQEDAQSDPAKRAGLKPDLSKPSIRQSSMPHNFDFGGIFK